jgi:hypothetical protein
MGVAAMITASIARAINTPKGWQAEYHLAGETEPHKLCDALGRPQIYPTAQDARVAALEALVAAMERADAAYIDPLPDQFWLEVKPKTSLGLIVQAKKRFARVEAGRVIPVERRASA